MPISFKSFKEFYPYYLREHRDFNCRILHFIGTSFFLAVVLFALLQGPLWLLVISPLCAYSFAWIGHFIFEKNQPATFQYPFYSMAADFVMYWHMLTFQIHAKLRAAEGQLEEKSN